MAAAEDVPEVMDMEIEDKSGALNGKYPLRDEHIRRTYYKFIEWPRSGRYYSINVHYDAPQHLCLDVFLSGKEELKPSVNLLSRFCRQETDAESDRKEVELEDRGSVDCLPNDVMLLIFRYFHPIELAHVISRVCGRWYGLCQAPCLWKEIRIFPCINRYCRSSLRTFLHRFQHFVKKLCIYDAEKSADGEGLFTKTDMADVFPSSMPSVTTLDLGRCSNFSIGFARFIIRCFPNLEVLNLEYASGDGEGSFRLIASQGLPRLRKLIVSCYRSLPDSIELSLQDFDPLCKSRQLQQLVIFPTNLMQPGYCPRISNSKMALSLTSLSITVRSEHAEESGALGHCQNLRYLSIFDYDGAAERTMRCLKTLRKLEHLHLSVGNFESGLESFFEADCRTKSDSFFPGTLKYLSLRGGYMVTDATVDRITANCPQLVSLGLHWSHAVTDVGLTYVIRRLKNLQFLDISQMNAVRGLALAAITPSDLTLLKYLCVAYTDADHALLRTLNLQRRDLVICDDYASAVTFEIKDGVAHFSGCRNESYKLYSHAIYSRFWGAEGYCCMHEQYPYP